ncbi:hypothetical protein GQ457_15G000300 [Hibiscus cannabinus]
MDSITASHERLEYANACVELEACSSIPKVIDVKMRIVSFVLVRVVVPWLLPSCPHCKIYGHGENVCPVKKPS